MICRRVLSSVSSKHWECDVNGKVRFKGEKTRRWSDSNYDYKETKYYSIFRGGQIAFDHVPVDGSKKMEDQLMESIEPYDFNEAKEFNAEVPVAGEEEKAEEAE